MKQVRLTNEETGGLCLALAQLVHAGIGMGDAFDLLAQDEPEGDYRTLLGNCARSADEGTPLAQLLRQAGCFPDYVCGLLEVGEQVGRVEESLNALAVYYDGRARMDRRIRAALLYPMVLLAVLLAVVVILLVWVLPVFNDVYAQLGSSLSGVAGGLLALGTVLRRLMPALCVLLTLAVLAAIVLAAQPALRERLAVCWQKRRGDRGVFGRIGTARFAQALAMGLSSGLTDLEAVELASRLSEGTDGFRLRCGDCCERLKRGEGLPAALRESGLLPKSQCRLLEAGMRSGSGERVMEQIAAHLLEESEEALEAQVGKVEPSLVVVMSVLVGGILLTVMLPLVEIMASIG